MLNITKQKKHMTTNKLKMLLKNNINMSGSKKTEIKRNYIVIPSKINGSKDSRDAISDDQKFFGECKDNIQKDKNKNGNRSIIDTIIARNINIS